jgi:hypothetical protein
MAMGPTLELNPMAETNHKSAVSDAHSPEAEEEPVDVEDSEAHVMVDTADADQDAMAKFQKATTLLENQKANVVHAMVTVLSDQLAVEDSDAVEVEAVSVVEKVAAVSAAVAVLVAQAHLAVVIMTTMRTKPNSHNTIFIKFHIKSFFLYR